MDNFYEKAYSKGFPLSVESLTNYGLLGTYLNVKPSDICLDVGCGSGAFVKEIKKTCRCFGIDLSIYGLLQTLSSGLLQADVETMPFKNEVFSKIIFSRSFSKLNPIKTLMEVDRCLQKPGKVIIFEYESPIYWDLVIKEVWQKYSGSIREPKSMQNITNDLIQVGFYPDDCQRFIDNITYPSHDALINRFLYYSPLQHLFNNHNEKELKNLIRHVVDEVYGPSLTTIIEWFVYTGNK